jgi:outer membrane protein assembly factor BamD (BamD/ComL family)
MAQRTDKTVVGQRVAGSPLVASLYVMSFFIGAIALIAVLFQLGEVLSKTQRAQIGEIVGIVLLGVGGVAAALLLAGVAAIINYLQNQMQIMNRLVRAQEDVATALTHMSRPEDSHAPSVPAAPVIPEAPVAQTTWIDSQRLEQIGELLQEISENVLLTPEQRQARQRQRVERMHRDLGEVLSRLLADGKFPEAQRRIDEYARSFPDERAAVEQFQARIEQARSQVEETDYQQAAGRIRDFMGMAAWERAEDVIQELLARHPRSQRVHSLVDDLRQERGKFEQQQRQQLLGEIEQLTGRKEWRHAFRLATDLLSRFPSSSEAQTLRGKMDTLRDNAEIEIRRDLEEQLKEMMRTHRYIEALALAQDIIAKYPNSPQAKVLKEQLPQMMSKAKLQMDQVGGA